MEIRGTTRTKGFLRISDLEGNETFMFLDGSDNEIYLVLEDFYNGLNIVNLNTAVTYDFYEEGWADRPIRRVKCHIEIDEK